MANVDRRPMAHAGGAALGVRQLRPSASRGGLEARGLGLPLRAEPALAPSLLDAAALIVGRPGQYVNAALPRDKALDRATVRRAPLGLIPGFGAELCRTFHLAGSPD